jgi:hypothetical protein
MLNHKRRQLKTGEFVMITIFWHFSPFRPIKIGNFLENQCDGNFNIKCLVFFFSRTASCRTAWNDVVFFSAPKMAQFFLRFWRKTKLNYAAIWSLHTIHWFLRKKTFFCRKKIAENCDAPVWKIFSSSSSFMDRRKSHVAAGPSVRLGL